MMLNSNKTSKLAQLGWIKWLLIKLINKLTRKDEPDPSYCVEAHDYDPEFW